MVEEDWKGNLVFEESEESVRNRKKYLLLQMTIFFIIWAVWNGISVFFLVTDPEFTMDLIDWLVTLCGLPVILIFFGLMWYFTRPVKLYENGIESTSGISKGFLLPYFAFERLDPPPWYYQGYYMLVSKQSSTAKSRILRIPTSMMDTPETRKYLEDKLAFSAMVGPSISSPTAESRSMLLKMEYVIYPLAYLLSIIIIISIIGFDMRPGEIYAGIFFALWFGPLVYPPILIMATQLTASVAKGLPTFRSERLWMGGLVGMIALSLALSPVGFISFNGLYPPDYAPDPRAVPASTTLAMGTYSNTTLAPVGDVLVEGVLVLDNVTLNMADGAQIWIAENGTLVTDGCTLRSEGSYKFRSFGCLCLNGSEISNLLSEIYWPNEWGGIEIYDGRAEIANCTIGATTTRAVMAYRAELTLANCTIITTGYEGIVLMESQATITDCDIAGSETGIMILNSAGVTVQNNIFKDNEDSIIMEDSEVRVQDNTFTDIEWSGITYDAASVLEQSNNSFTNVGTRTSYSSTDMPGEICFIPLIIEAVVAIGILWYINTRLGYWTVSNNNLQCEEKK